MKPLNPLMAVLVIASVGASPLRAIAVDGIPTASPVAAAADNPINALTAVIASNPVARADAGNRISEFLLEKFRLETDSSDRSFVGAGVNRELLGAVVRDWALKSPADGVAVLYFVIGPKAATPTWVPVASVLSKTFKPGMKWETRLRLALTEGRDWTGEIKISKTHEKEQAVAFLIDAVEKARSVFNDDRTKKEVDASINAHNTTAPVALDTTRTGGLNGSSREYTMDDLYVNGAVVANVSGPNDPGSRRISMKIYSTRMKDGTILDQIGIFDITKPDQEIYGQRFTISEGDKTFALDDRTPGHKKYKLTFTDGPNGERNVSFARPDGGAALTTTLSQLFNKRADQAGSVSPGLGNVVKVGGEEFYVVPQGGSRSALVLFPKAVIDNRTTDGYRLLVPALMATVSERADNGTSRNIPSVPPNGPPLGMVGDTQYHLEFNKKLGVWEVKEGAGTPPPADTTGDGAGPAGPGGGKPPAKPDGEMSIKDLGDLLVKVPGCTRNPDDTKDLALELKDKYGIIACAERGGTKQIILVPKSALNPDQQVVYPPTSGDFKLLRARFAGHYLVLAFDKQQQYLDLLKQSKDEEGKETNFSLAGFVAEKNATKFDDVLPFVDALKHYMGIASSSPDAKAFTAVPTRLAAALGSKPYWLNGSFAKGALIVIAEGAGDTFQIWPKDGKPGAGTDPSPAPNPYSGLSGPANAMNEGGVSSVDTPFPLDNIKLPDSHLALPMAGKVTEEGGIAVYESDDSPKKYYVMFRYRANDPTGGKDVKFFRQKPFEVFNDTNPLPKSFDQMGLSKEGAVVKDRVASGYGFITPGTTKDKGVLAVFQNKQVRGGNQKDPAGNCVGPIVWWGMDRPAAQKACLEDKL